jgi:hypothetical protein
MSRLTKAILAAIGTVFLGWLMVKYLPVGLLIIIIAWLTGVATFLLFGAVLYWWARRQQRKRQERDEERAKRREVAMEYKPPPEPGQPDYSSIPCPKCMEWNNRGRSYCKHCGWLLAHRGPSQLPRPRGAEFPPIT